jgi:hypothetical protein
MDSRDRLAGNDVIVWGRNTIIGTAWEELYAYEQPLDWSTILAAAAKVDVTSSSAADTSAGTGARTIRLIGLDASYKLLVEDLTMNGQTAVTSAGSFLRLFGAEVLTAGTGLINAGDIHIVKTGTSTWTAGVPATLTSALCKILIGWGSSQNGMFTTPAGTTWRLRSIIAGCRTQAGTLGIFARELAAATNPLRLIHSIDLSATSSTYYDLEYCGAALTFKEKTDVLMRGLGAAASAVINATMTLKKTDGA